MLIDGKEVPEPETPAIIAGASSNVENAVEAVNRAATETPDTAIHMVLSSVSDVLKGVQAELKRANDLAEKSVSSVPEPAPVPLPVEPDVTIETPAPAKRVIRRNGRKIKR